MSDQDFEAVRTLILADWEGTNGLIGRRTEEMDSLNSSLAEAREERDGLRRVLARTANDRDRLRDLLRIAYRYLSAGEHDCTGPEDCWTCAVDEVLGEGKG